jgi:hypothetical protein
MTAIGFLLSGVVASGGCGLLVVDGVILSVLVVYSVLTRDAAPHAAAHTGVLGLQRLQFLLQLADLLRLSQQALVWGKYFQQLEHRR